MAFPESFIVETMVWYLVGRVSARQDGRGQPAISERQMIVELTRWAAGQTDLTLSDVRIRDVVNNLLADGRISSVRRGVGIGDRYLFASSDQRRLLNKRTGGINFLRMMIGKIDDKYAA